MNIKIKRLTSTAKIPEYAKPGDSGFDLHADIPEEITILQCERETISTGISVAIPEGFELQVRSRSGLASKNGLMVLNSPGTVDSGYRGEISVIIFNSDYDREYTISPGDKIAQGVICPIIKAEFTEVSELDETERGVNGFGSSGK